MAQTTYVTGPLSDYTKLVKDYTIQGQQETLWEQFFSGLETKYTGLGQRVQEAYTSGVSQIKEASAYDISSAYANYKQQQLQLQLNEQLGEGFKQQLGTRLGSQYGTAFESLKTQEASDIAELGTEYTSAVAELQEQYASEYEEGEAQFTQLGEQLRNYEKLIQTFAKQTPIKKPTNVYSSSTNTKTRETVYELTDEGRLWYYDVLEETTPEGLTFDQWLQSEDLGSEDVSYEDRIALWETYRQNPDLFKRQVAGLTPDFDAQTVREALEKHANAPYLEEITSKSANVKALTEGDMNLDSLSSEQLKEISDNLSRTNDYVSTSSYDNTIGFPGKTFSDKYGNKWRTITGNMSYSPGSSAPGDKEAARLGKELGIFTSKGWRDENTKYTSGDIIYHKGKYYILDISKGSFSYREIERE